MTKRILSSVPNGNGCVEYWRNIIPLTALEDVDTDFYQYMLDGPQCDWVRLRRANVVFTHHPLNSAHMHTLDVAKFVHRQIWMDFDDNYWNISPKNHSREHYNANVMQMIAASIEKSDFFSVTTDPLREVVEKLVGNKPVVVIPNAIDDELKWPTTKRKKLVIYRGSYKTHAHDLLSVASEFQKVIDDNPDWTFLFYGNHPVSVSAPNVGYTESMLLPIFHSTLQESGAAIMVNPLEFSSFNECKSNIAWIEASLAGAAFLGPDIPPYREPGATVYKPGKFGDRLRDLIAASDMDRNTLVQRAQKAVDAKYRLSVVNQIRTKIIDGL